MKTMLSAVSLVLAAVLVVPGAAMAEKSVPFQTPAQLKDKCNRAGGMYGPPSAQGVYTCVLGSGNVIACGGVGAYAGTCGTGDNPARVVDPSLGLNDRPATGARIIQQ
jgi:hypothetical protein